jgi:hypothetical protein
MQVVQQRGESTVGRREELVFEVRERVAVRVPRFVVPQVHLDEVDARFHQSACHQQRPAEGVAAVAVEHLGLGVDDVEGAAHASVGQE